jgi:hypothetical protein
MRRSRYVVINSNEFNRERTNYLVRKLERKFPYPVIEEIEEEQVVKDLKVLSLIIYSEKVKIYTKKLFLNIFL